MRIYQNITEIKQANKDAGMYFFDRDTMRFFANRIFPKVYQGRFFITSEKKGFEDMRRDYCVREADEHARIQTRAKFPTKKEAEAYIKLLSFK